MKSFFLLVILLSSLSIAFSSQAENVLWVLQGESASLKGNSSKYDAIASFGANPCLIVAVKNVRTGDLYMVHADEKNSIKLALLDAYKRLGNNLNGLKLAIYLSTADTYKQNALYLELKSLIKDPFFDDRFFIKDKKNSEQLKLGTENGRILGFFEIDRLNSQDILNRLQRRVSIIQGKNPDYNFQDYYPFYHEL
jgi:hypothetical protein